MTPAEAVSVHGGIKPAARALGIPYSTFRAHFHKGQAVEAPAPVPVHLPIETLLEQATERFELARSIDSAEQWPVVQIRDKRPIGVLWFGDPHLGDNGCNVPLLRQHARLCAETDGLYGANIGDTTNNWMTSGKLARLWSDQDASLSTERRLAQWLMNESGVNWLVWLIGNHDAWNSGETILRQMNTTAIFMHNWEAKFKLQFPSGEQIKIHAAHNFKGFSDWNPMHGPLKAAIKTSDADLYVAGHIHTPGSMQIDLPGSSRFPLLLRVASYKRFDLHAKLHGFADHPVGCAVLTIFNPEANDPTGKITHYFDVELGARVLTMMRNQKAKPDGTSKGNIRCGGVSGTARPRAKRGARNAPVKKQGLRQQRPKSGSGVQHKRRGGTVARPH